MRDLQIPRLLERWTVHALHLVASGLLAVRLTEQQKTQDGAGTVLRFDGVRVAGFADPGPETLAKLQGRRVRIVAPEQGGLRVLPQNQP